MPVATRHTVNDPYMKLINEFPLRRIKSAASHAKAAKLVLRLSNPPPNEPADRGTADYLDILIDLIVDYEKRSNQRIDTSKVSAADLVRHRLDERGMSVSALAKLIAVPQSNLSDMLNGKRDWSKEAMRGLAKELNIRAERFLGD